MTASTELNAALAAKASAETQMIAARQAITTANQEEKVRIDLEIRRANLRVARAQAEQQEAMARSATIITRVGERDEQERLADWRYQHICHVYGEITEIVARTAMAYLNVMDHDDPKCDIQVILNSPGSPEALWGLALFDYICRLRKTHRVTTIAEGGVMSMAAVVLQAGDVRVMTKEAWLMIHKFQSTAAGGPEKLKDVGKWTERMCERAKTIFVERSGGKLTADQMEKLWDSSRDWTLDSDEALSLGIIDEVW